MPSANHLPLDVTSPDRARPHRANLLFRAPPPGRAAAILLGLSVLLAFLLWAPSWTLTAEGFLAVFLVPALIAGVATPPLSRLLGGRLELQRSLFLVMMVLLIELPIAAVGRVGLLAVPSYAPGAVAVALFLQGPALWFRQLSLYGVSISSHPRSLAPAILQPLLAILGAFLILPPTGPLLLATAIFLVVAFLCAFLLLRAVDRPLRREFQSSGVSMMRPLIDHVNRRDAAATGKIEQFFAKAAIPADLRVSLLSFFSEGRARATIALPTVHPGPFGAIGASDLPRKLEEQLGAAAGTVFVPHTPCDHDLDLPTEAELQKVGGACRELFSRLARPPRPARASPLVSPYPGSLARAQLIGEVAIVLVTQAPEPTDDIAFSVADRIVREIRAEGGPEVALIDAHNSYIEGRGDIAYATPLAEKLVADAKAAVREAQRQARDGPIELGVATRGGYEIGRDGIAPQGIRAWVLRAAGTTSAYVLIDGNNLAVGMRDPIVAALRRHVDAAEVMTTDNHVVHESDGSTNPVGERYSCGSLAGDSSSVVTAALASLGPVEVRFGTQAVPNVMVLGPGYTTKLLTAISDTVSMLGHSLLMTLLLLLASSLVVLVALK